MLKTLKLVVALGVISMAVQANAQTVTTEVEKPKKKSRWDVTYRAIDRVTGDESQFSSTIGVAGMGTVSLSAEAGELLGVPLRVEGAFALGSTSDDPNAFGDVFNRQLAAQARVAVEAVLNKYAGIAVQYSDFVHDVSSELHELTGADILVRLRPLSYNDSRLLIEFAPKGRRISVGVTNLKLDL